MELLIEAARYIGGAVVRLTGWLNRRAPKRPPPEIREDMVFLDEPPYLGFVTTIEGKAESRKPSPTKRACENSPVS